MYIFSKVSNIIICHLYYLLMLLTFYFKVISEFLLNGFESAKLLPGYRKLADIPDDLTGKTVVITGVDTGIGRATLETVASKGATVIGTFFLKNTEKSLVSELTQKYPTIKRSNLKVVYLNLASFESIKACAQKINTLTCCIDVLINNAGVMCPNDDVLRGRSTSKQIEYHFQVNYLGHFYLTLLLLDKLKKTTSTTARIVNLTSFTHLIGYPLFERPRLFFQGLYVSEKLKAYARSKLAIVLSTQTLARKLSSSNIKVYSVHPGGTISSIVKHIEWMYYWQNTVAVPFQLTPFMGSQTTLHCAFSEDKEVINSSGSYFDNCQKVWQLYSHAVDESDAAKLWTLSFALCQLNEKDYF